MFGIGFFELLVIAVLGLLVFGPEKLPEAIRTFAFGFSKAKRSWQNTRRELEQELGMDEIRREIHNAQILENIEKTKKLNMDAAENNIAEYIAPSESESSSTADPDSLEEAATEQQSSVTENDETAQNDTDESNPSQSNISPKSTS